MLTLDDARALCALAVALPSIAGCPRTDATVIASDPAREAAASPSGEDLGDDARVHPSELSGSGQLIKKSDAGGDGAFDTTACLEKCQKASSACDNGCDHTPTGTGCLRKCGCAYVSCKQKCASSGEFDFRCH